MALKLRPALLYVFAIVCFYYVESGVSPPATVKLIENAICQRHYARLDGVRVPVKEELCKINPVQDKLASVRGWYSFWTTLPVLLLGTYFGNLADTVGRRKVMAISVVGMILGHIWVFIVCNSWRSLPVELVWLTAMLRCIGGGAFVIIALYMTMASDLAQEDNRSQVLYIVFAVKLIVELVAPLIASTTLEYSLWLPYLVCVLALFLILPCLLLMPETRSSTYTSPVPNTVVPPTESDESQSHQGTSNQVLQSAKGQSSLKAALQSYQNILRKGAISLALLTDFILQFRYNTVQILLPYVSVRFGWTIAKTSQLLALIPGASLLVFVTLPFLAEFLHERRSLAPAHFNVFVLRSLSTILTLGAILLACATSIGTFVFALLVFSVGFNVRAPVLAYLSDHIDSARDTARIYIVVSILDAFVHMVASPLVEKLWAKALDLGGRWLMLPFMFSALLFIVASVLVFFLPTPHLDKSIVREVSEHRPLLSETLLEQEDNE